MKVPAAILMFILAFSYFQPAFCYVESDLIEMDCGADMECSMPADGEMPCEEDPGENNGDQKHCTIIACSGCTFVLVENSSLTINVAFISSGKQFIKNDNRVIKATYEFWKPPNVY